MKIKLTKDINLDSIKSRFFRSAANFKLYRDNDNHIDIKKILSDYSEISKNHEIYVFHHEFFIRCRDYYHFFLSSNLSYVMSMEFSERYTNNDDAKEIEDLVFKNEPSHSEYCNIKSSKIEHYMVETSTNDNKCHHFISFKNKKMITFLAQDFFLEYFTPDMYTVCDIDSDVGCLTGHENIYNFLDPSYDCIPILL